MATTEKKKMTPGVAISKLVNAGRSPYGNPGADAADAAGDEGMGDDTGENMKPMVFCSKTECKFNKDGTHDPEEDLSITDGDPPTCETYEPKEGAGDAGGLMGGEAMPNAGNNSRGAIAPGAKEGM